MTAPRLLAEDFIAKPSYRLGNKLIHGEHMVATVKKADKFVLDERATRLVTQLSNSYPKQVAAMLPVAWPAADAVWIELPTEIMLNEREKFNGPGWRPPGPPRLPHHRLAVFAHKLPTDSDRMLINCIEHAEDDNGVLAWPLGFVLNKAPRPDKTRDQWAARLWGYGDAADMRPLLGWAVISAHPEFGDDDRFLNLLLRELGGFMRLSVAALAALNAVADVGPIDRPPGRIIGKGGNTHPRQAHAFVTVNIPHRVKDTSAYVRRQFTTYHKRLHEVRAHYRHLQFEPNAPGWEYVETHLGPRWRKAIPAHLRGDPELGVVEHKGFAVKALSFSPETREAQPI